MIGCMKRRWVAVSRNPRCLDAVLWYCDVSYGFSFLITSQHSLKWLVATLQKNWSPCSSQKNNLSYHAITSSDTWLQATALNHRPNAREHHVIAQWPCSSGPRNAAPCMSGGTLLSVLEARDQLEYVPRQNLRSITRTTERQIYDPPCTRDSTVFKQTCLRTKK